MYGAAEWFQANMDGIAVTCSTSWHAISEFFVNISYAIVHVKPFNTDTGFLQGVDIAWRECC